MIKYLFLFVFSIGILHGQTAKTQAKLDIEVGDLLEIGRPESNVYKHIDFPALNFIIKRGGVANYKLVQGETVVVTAVKELKDGTTQVKLKRSSGGRFFGSHSVVKADFQDAMESGELRATRNSG